MSAAKQTTKPMARVLAMTFRQFITEIRENEKRYGTKPRLRGTFLFGNGLEYDISWLLLKENRKREGPRLPLGDLPIDTLRLISDDTFKRIPNVGQNSIDLLRTLLKESGIEGIPASGTFLA